MTLRIASEQRLVWVHPDPFTRVSELRSGPEVIATLTSTDVLGGSAIGDAEGIRWTFAWVGIVRPTIHVRLAGAASDVVTVKLPLFGWGGRPWLVQFAAGRVLHWAASRWWSGYEYLLTEADGVVLLRFKRPLFEQQFTRSGKIHEYPEVEDVARSLPELPLLLLLGKHLIR